MTATLHAGLGRAAGRVVVSACAPGRICLAGESLDWMTGGPSVVAAVPLHTEVTVFRDDHGGPVVVRSAHADPVSRRLDAAELSTYAGGGLDYMQATAYVISRSRGRRWLDGTTIAATSQVPIGAGLSSSAALTVATAAGLLSMAPSGITAGRTAGSTAGTAVGEVPSAMSVARAAYDAEAGQLGTGAGWMDFLACAYGGVCRVDAGDPPTVTRLADTLDTPLILIDTLTRRSTSAALVAMRDRYRAGKRERHHAGDPDMRSYVRSATAIVEQMTATVADLTPDPAQVGELLTQGHTILRDLVRCSTDLINECLTRCLTAGAYGGKLTGSGHGGCLFALAPLEAIGPVVAALRDLPVQIMVFTTGEPHGVMFGPARQP